MTTLAVSPFDVFFTQAELTEVDAVVAEINYELRKLKHGNPQRAKIVGNTIQVTLLNVPSLKVSSGVAMRFSLTGWSSARLAQIGNMPSDLFLLSSSLIASSQDC